MALTVYGSPRSRTMRVLWLAEELNLEFEHVPYEFDDPRLKTPEFLSLNAQGAIPTIVDDGHAVAESLAINLYLAKKYGRVPLGLYADSPEEEAEIWQWTLWVQGHLEPWVQKDQLLRDLIQAIGDRANVMIRLALHALDSALQEKTWLVGSRFTVADMNVAAVLSPSRASGLHLTPHPRVQEWLSRCYARPAAMRVRSRYSRV